MPHHHHKPNAPAYRSKTIARDHPHHPENRANEHMERWFLGGFLALMSLVALFLAAHTAQGEFYGPGLLLFGLCLIGIFNLMRRSFDEQDRHK
jgi:hypothetical protein